MNRLNMTVMVSFALSASAMAQERDGTIPASDTVVTAPVGADVWEHFHYLALPAVTTESPIVKNIVLAHVNTPPGAKWISTNSKRVFKACYIPTGAPLVGASLMNGCAIDDDRDGTFDRIAGNPTQGAVKLDQKVPYKPSEYLMPRAGDVRQKLIFSGVDATSIKLSYREFSDDLARPAFTQELSFERSKLPQVIRFRDISISVEALSGEGMRYRILPK